MPVPQAQRLFGADPSLVAADQEGQGREYWLHRRGDLTLRDSCDLRENNEGCWGWDPSCADCLWAQDIVRCPGAGR